MTCATCEFWEQYNRPAVNHGHCRHPQAYSAHRTQGTFGGYRCSKWAWDYYSMQNPDHRMLSERTERHVRYDSAVGRGKLPSGVIE